MSGAEAFRATVRGRVQGVGFRAATIGEAKRLGVLGWVRNTASGEVQVHAEGEPEALRAFVAFLGRGPAGASVEGVALTAAKPEGHEQFAMRGVPAGRFRVVSAGGEPAGFVLTLEVAGGVRAWRLPRPPSMVPAEKRFAALLDAVPESGDAVWDEGAYEQGGRVPWPEAIERGHAVFVLHGTRLQGGFALQRTGRGWLLVKRRDEHAAG